MGNQLAYSSFACNDVSQDPLFKSSSPSCNRFGIDSWHISSCEEVLGHRFYSGSLRCCPRENLSCQSQEQVGLLVGLEVPEQSPQSDDQPLPGSAEGGQADFDLLLGSDYQRLSDYSWPVRQP